MAWREELAKLTFIKTILPALEGKHVFQEANFFCDLRITLEKKCFFLFYFELLDIQEIY